jgi:hypothetical protein
VSALDIYQSIIEDLTRRFDRIEAALETLTDLNLPEWAQRKLTAALHYAECSIEERDSLDEMAADRCVCETFAVHAGDPDEQDYIEDDTQNDYAGDADPDEDDGGDDGDPDGDEFDGDDVPHSAACPCGQHPAPAARAMMQPAPLVAEDDAPYRPRFGNPADIVFAHNKRGRR